MAIGANSYGTVLGVAALSPRYTIGGTFTTASQPTLAQVEQWIDQISGMMNVYIASKGFAIPITQADAVLSLAPIVLAYVADLVLNVNGAGQLGNDGETISLARQWIIIGKGVRESIDEVTVGWERLGATRTTSVFGNVGYMTQTNSGGTVFSMFTRKSFGGETFTEEDAA